MRPRHLFAGAALGALVLTISACGGSNEPDQRTAEPSKEEVRKALSEIEIHGADPEDRVAADAASGETAPANEPSEEESETDDHSHEADMAGGEAHVHGKAEAAIVLEGRNLSVNIEAPLASLGARESEPETPEQETERTSLRVQLADPLRMVDINTDATCIFTGSDIAFRYSGDHGAASLTYSFQCNNPGGLETLVFRAFESFPTLEEVDVVALSGTEQEAVTLSAASPELSWPFD